MRDALPGTGNRGQPNYTTCGGWALSENPTYCAFWSVFGATCLSLQPLASSVGFGTTARVAPGKNLPDSGVTSEPVGCYATPAQLGGSSGICRTTRPVPCYEEAHSPCECSLLTLINRRPPRLVRGTHAHFQARPRPRRRNLETGAHPWKAPTPRRRVPPIRIHGR